MDGKRTRKARVWKCPLMWQGWTLNLMGVFLTRNPELVTTRVVNHERIHTAQMRELLWLPFYIIYGVEWLLRLIVTRSAGRAYRAVSFEREAYANDGNPAYLCRRRHFAQWRRG